MQVERNQDKVPGLLEVLALKVPGLRAWGVWGTEAESLTPRISLPALTTCVRSFCLDTHDEASARTPIACPFLEKPISVTAVPGLSVPPTCRDLHSPDPRDASRNAPNPPPAAVRGPGGDRDLGG